MPRGRRPEPAAIKRAKGNPGRRRIAEPIPASTEAGVPQDFAPPAWLDTGAEGELGKAISAIAIATWQRLVPELRAMHLLRTTDLELFAVGCRAMGEWVVYTAQIDRDGPTYVTTSPHVGEMKRAHPLRLARKDALQTLKEWGEQFGLTPSHRLRIYQQLSVQQPSLPGMAPRSAVEEDEPEAAPRGHPSGAPIGFLGRLN